MIRLKVNVKKLYEEMSSNKTLTDFIDNLQFRLIRYFFNFFKNAPASSSKVQLISFL